jgi:hypothetical protein
VTTRRNYCFFFPNWERSNFVLHRNASASEQQYIICVVSQDAQLPRDDEEHRLLAVFEACSAKQVAPSNQLSHPRHSMLYPAYVRLMDVITAIGLMCNEIRLAFRAHRKKMRGEREMATTTASGVETETERPAARSQR